MELLALPPVTCRPGSVVYLLCALGQVTFASESVSSSIKLKGQAT